MIWFFNCFYLCQVIKIAWIINRENFIFATKFIFFIGLISIKYLQSTKFRVKCYKCYETIRKNCDDYPSVRIPKPEQLKVFNILILPMIEPLLLYFSNHILVFFVASFEFSLKFLTSVYRVTVNHFRMGGGQFYRLFIIRVLDYLLYYTKKTFTVLFVNIFIKLFYIIGIFTHFSISICINFLCNVFRIFYYFMFGCLFSLVFALLLCVFVNVSHVSYLFASFNDLMHHQVLFRFFIFILILTKMLIAFKVIITPLQKIK